MATKRARYWKSTERLKITPVVIKPPLKLEPNFKIKYKTRPFL